MSEVQPSNPRSHLLSEVFIVPEIGRTHGGFALNFHVSGQYPCAEVQTGTPPVGFPESWTVKITSVSLCSSAVGAAEFLSLPTAEGFGF